MGRGNIFHGPSVGDFRELQAKFQILVGSRPLMDTSPRKGKRTTTNKIKSRLYKSIQTKTNEFPTVLEI